MRILFVYPEHYLNVGIPGGIATLSASLKQHGHKTALFDTSFLKTDPEFNSRHFSATELHKDLHGGLGEKEADRVVPSIFKPTAYTIEDLVRNDPVVSAAEEFQKAIDDFRPDLIALSTMTSTFDTCLDLLRAVRYDCKVIAGGVHPTIATDDTMAQKEIDMACVGEGENPFVELCNLMEAGKDHTNVASMVFRMPDGSIKKNPLGPRTCIDELATPDWGLFDSRHLFRPFEGEIYKGTFYMQSRGCPMRCTYCINSTVAGASGGMKNYYRCQKPAVTIKHLTELKEKHGVSWIKFTDDTFLLPSEDHLRELGEGLKRLGIMFGCSVMPNTITKEKVRIAREMGCVAMTVGVESGNAQIRERIKRNYDDDSLVQRLKMILDADIRLSTFNIIGFPGETRENVFETIRLNRRIGTKACNVYILFPYPGTPIQMEEAIPVRGMDGRIMPVEEGKHLGLSEMSADELESLQKTFNLYLYIPENLWPFVAIAERHDETGASMLDIVHRFAMHLVTETPIKTVAFEAAKTGLVVEIPSLLAEALSLPLTDDDKLTLIGALKAEYSPAKAAEEEGGFYCLPAAE